MTGGKSPIGYLKAYMTNLYLSTTPEKVAEAIEAGKRRYPFITARTFDTQTFILNIYLILFPSIIIGTPHKNPENK